MTNAELKERIHALTDAGEVMRARLHRFARKWGWKDEDLKTLTPEWDAVTENIDREGKQS